MIDHGRVSAAPPIKRTPASDAYRNSDRSEARWPRAGRRPHRSKAAGILRGDADPRHGSLDRPEGLADEGKPDDEAAAQEAFEEAGVEGEISRDPVGSFTYEKRVDKSREIIRVTVYLLEVATKHKVWPEKAERRRRWMTPAEATLLVDEPGLRAILRQLNASTDRGCAEAPLA